jgi:hypothetical protein
MGLMTKKVMTADVTLSGITDDPDSSDVAAQVGFTAHGREMDSRDLVAFIPMAVVGTLRGCRSAPNHGRPFLNICNEVADALLECGSAGAKEFRLRDVTGEPLDMSEFWAPEPDLVTEGMVDRWLRQCMPEIADRESGGHTRRFKAILQVPRSGSRVPFVSPWSRNAFVGIQGTLAMFEAAARTADYAATTRPLAATTKRLLNFNEDVFGSEAIPELGEATWLYQLVDAIHAADDPLSADLPSFVEGESADQSIMQARMGRWVRESGLSIDAAATELSRRVSEGEPLPWEEADSGR